MNKKILCLVIISLFCSHSLANQSVNTEKLVLSLPVLLTIWGTVKNTGLNNVDFRWESIKPLQALNGQDSHACKLSQKDAATSSATSSQSEAGSKKQYKKNKGLDKLFIKSMKTFAQVLEDNPDIDFLFVMDIDDTLIHPVKNRKEFKRHQEWLHRVDILARKYKNFIMVYNTARPMMFNERVSLGFENVAPVDCGNVGWLRSHRKMLEIGYANSAKNLPKKIGIPVPDAIISSLGMTFQVKPSLVNKTPFLKENIEELNKQLLIMAERDTETLRSEIEKFKTEFPDTTVFNNGNIYNQMVTWSNAIIKNKWLFRIPPPNKTVLNTVVEYRGVNAGLASHNQYLINKGTGLRIVIGILRKAGRIKENRKTILISLGDSHQDLPFLIPNNEVSSLGEDGYTSEAKQEREQKIRAISAATTIEIPSLDMTSSLYSEDDSLTWFMSVVFHAEGRGMYYLGNEAIDKSLSNKKLVHVTGTTGPDLLLRGMERVVEKLKEYFEQKAGGS